MSIINWDFSEGTFGWQGGFADYPPGEEAFYELDFGLRSLPPPLGDEQALFITGANRSDDLFMYFRNLVSLSPDTAYQAVFDVQLASNAPDGSFGIGGSPANSVFLKAGATPVEPLAIADASSNLLQLNIDKGAQSQIGQDSVVLGDIAKPDDGTFDYALIERDNRNQPFTFRTDSSGEAWLYFGTDSGFEGTTTLYYTQFRAEFTPVTAPTSVPEPTSSVLLLALGMLAIAAKVQYID